MKQFLPSEIWTTGRFPWPIAINSVLSVRSQRQSHLVTLPWVRVNQLMKWVSAPGMPSINPLHVLVQSGPVTAFKWIFKLARSQLWSASVSSLNLGLQTGSTMVYKLARLWPRSSHDPGLPSASQIAHNPSLQVHMIMGSKWIFKLALSWLPSSPLSSGDCYHESHLKLLSFTAYSQSRYTVWWWVATYIHRYIDS